MLESKGMKINRIADVAPFRTAVMPVYDSFKAVVGADLMQEVLAAVQ